MQLASGLLRIQRHGGAIRSRWLPPEPSRARGWSVGHRRRGSATQSADPGVTRGSMRQGWRCLPPSSCVGNATRPAPYPSVPIGVTPHKVEIPAWRDVPEPASMGRLLRTVRRRRVLYRPYRVRRVIAKAAYRSDMRRPRVGEVPYRPAEPAPPDGQEQRGVRHRRAVWKSKGSRSRAGATREDRRARGVERLQLADTSVVRGAHTLPLKPRNHSRRLRYDNDASRPATRTPHLPEHLAGTSCASSQPDSPAVPVNRQAYRQASQWNRKSSPSASPTRSLGNGKPSKLLFDHARPGEAFVCTDGSPREVLPRQTQDSNRLGALCVVAGATDFRRGIAE